MCYAVCSFIQFCICQALVLKYNCCLIRCLLYLSDTYGEFPESAPQYDTVFVVPEEDVSIFSEPDRRSKQVPEWVKMVVLTEDDLKSEDEWKNAL